VAVAAFRGELSVIAPNMAAAAIHVLVMLVATPDREVIEPLFVNLGPAFTIYVALRARLTTEVVRPGVAVAAGET
jgi:hypothetical protein